MKNLTLKFVFPLLLSNSTMLYAQVCTKNEDGDQAAIRSNHDATPKVQIEGQRQSRIFFVAGATKNDSLLIDLPLSVKVLSKELLNEVGANSMRDALDLVSGIQRQSNLGGLWDSYAMRGFTGDPNFGSDYMVNGINSSRGYNGIRDNANTEAIEILKGPASALYGRGEPGGTVNILTKKPRFDRGGELDIEVGSANHRRVATDLTGSISDQIAYRLNIAKQFDQSNRQPIGADKLFFSPSILWRINGDTTASYELEVIEQNSPFDRGVVAVNGQLGSVPNSRFLGEPKDGRIKVKSIGSQILFQHDLGRAWSVQTALSYRDSSLRGYSSEASSLLLDNETLRRQRRFRDFSASDRSARFELNGTHSLAGIQSQSLFGLEHVQFADERLQLRRNPSLSNPYSISILNPTYGTQADPLVLSINTKEVQEVNAGYIQEQTYWGENWRTLAGIRLDRYKQNVENRRNSLLSSQSLQSISPRIGVVYQPSKNFAWYLSMSKGFRPNSGVSVTGDTFSPERSRSYEAGLKWESQFKDVTATLSIFDIDKMNVLTTNPTNTDFSVTAGKLRSKGVEFDIDGQLFDNIRVVAAYAYTDAKVSKGDNLIVAGSRFPNVPSHSGSVFLKQRFYVNGSVASVGIGAQYVGKRLGDVAVSSSFLLPAYTSFRFSGDYMINKNTKINFYVNNLFDRQFYASSYSPLWVQPGTERQVGANLHLKF